MVIYDRKKNESKIFEIKHSKKMVWEQMKNLINDEMVALTERRFGKVTGKYVIYQGEPCECENGIRYLNACEFLKGLPNLSMTI